MSGITITDVKIVALCSKCRTEEDEIPRNKYGVAYGDKDLSCVCCGLGCSHETEEDSDVDK